MIKFFLIWFEICLRELIGSLVDDSLYFELLGDLSTTEGLLFGLLQQGDLDNEELCFFDLDPELFFFYFLTFFFFECFSLTSSKEKRLFFSENLLDFVNLAIVPLPLDRYESSPSSISLQMIEVYFLLSPLLISS